MHRVVLVGEPEMSGPGRLSIALTDAGIDCVVAIDLPEALATLRARPKPTAMVIDVELAELSIEVLMRCLDQDASLKPIPRLLVSAQALPPSELKRLGAREVLPNPLGMEPLLAALKRIRVSREMKAVR